MGLILFPGDGDTTSPDVAWSYTGFNAFRHRLAQAEAWNEWVRAKSLRRLRNDVSIRGLASCG